MGTTLGITMGTNLVLQHPKYNKTQLIQISSKGDKFYVVGTRPVELYEGKTKQDRLSTGTSDEREAHRMWDKLEAQLYSKWDKLLNRDPFIELLREHWPNESVGGDPYIEQLVDEWLGDGSVPRQRLVRFHINQNMRLYKDDRSLVRKRDRPTYNHVNDYLKRPCVNPETFMARWKTAKQKACLVVWKNTGCNHSVVNELFKYLDVDDAQALRHAITPKQNPYPVHIQQQRIDEERINKAVPALNSAADQTKRNKEKPEPVLNKTGCPTILEMLPLYEQDTTRWKDVTIKEKRTSTSKLKNIAALLGDLPIDQIRSHHATIIARTLDEDGNAKSTISKWVRSLKLMLDWSKSTDTAIARNLTKQPPENWIDHNFITVKDVSNYGLKARSWEPFTEDQLYKLFALPMTEKDRLLLSILATTGMRLDEAALLTWSQVKETNGIRYFDLTEAKVKNSNSRRKVALPDILKLPKPDADPTAKLFTFRVDEDGKSSKHASHHLNLNYAHKVRYDDEDNRKVIHSFRHNMITFMINLDPTPSSEVMDWIVGHDEDGGTKSMRRKNYAHDIALERKYEVVNRIHHPWLTQKA